MIGAGDLGTTAASVDSTSSRRLVTASENWTPNQAITVGAYGVFNPQTAEFEKEGSIYNYDFAPEIHDEINKRHGIQACPTADQLIVVSRGCTKDQAFTAEFKTALTSPEWIIRDKARIQFSEALEGKALITSVYTCPRFALLLTDNATERADAAAIGPSVMNIAGASGETEPEGENTFLQYQPPWNVLDDEGNEISPESPQLNQGEILDF
ncbi:hypothetical protein D9758_005896 [Tetrapyrgos nigripes]|uniref:Uncharacterized protein n=1 Tax=Tetrapyrgos nigripes TaxID=182062 RepID=A0A8H5LHI1_9AGAR|nr:hypothetical protein D9758_005896 [Tetrapyrgos nigripes]